MLLGYRNVRMPLADFGHRSGQCRKRPGDAAGNHEGGQRRHHQRQAKQPYQLGLDRRSRGLGRFHELYCLVPRPGPDCVHLLAKLLDLPAPITLQQGGRFSLLPRPGQTDDLGPQRFPFCVCLDDCFDHLLVAEEALPNQIEQFPQGVVKRVDSRECGIDFGLARSQDHILHQAADLDNVGVRVGKGVCHGERVTIETGRQRRQSIVAPEGDITHRRCQDDDERECQRQSQSDSYAFKHWAAPSARNLYKWGPQASSMQRWPGDVDCRVIDEGVEGANDGGSRLTLPLLTAGPENGDQIQTESQCNSAHLGHPVSGRQRMQA